MLDRASPESVPAVDGCRPPRELLTTTVTAVNRAIMRDEG
jgi:hypothetical protein